MEGQSMTQRVIMVAMWVNARQNKVICKGTDRYSQQYDLPRSVYMTHKELWSKMVWMSLLPQCMRAVRHAMEKDHRWPRLLLHNNTNDSREHCHITLTFSIMCKVEILTITENKVRFWGSEEHSSKLRQLVIHLQCMSQPLKPLGTNPARVKPSTCPPLPREARGEASVRGTCLGQYTHRYIQVTRTGVGEVWDTEVMVDGCIWWQCTQILTTHTHAHTHRHTHAYTHTRTHKSSNMSESNGGEWDSMLQTVMNGRELRRTEGDRGQVKGDSTKQRKVYMRT